MHMVNSMSEENKNILGRYLRMLRKTKKIKQDVVADAIGVKRATYSHYENGRIIPPTSMLATLSAFFETDLDKMVKMAVKDKSNDDSITTTDCNSLDEEEIIFYYKHMPEEDRNLTKAIIKEIYIKGNSK